MDKKGFSNSVDQEAAAGAEAACDQPGDRLWPIFDRLEALKELLLPPPPAGGDEPLELSGCGRRGLSYVLGDISAEIEKAADEISGDFYDLKEKALASASRQEARAPMVEVGNQPPTASIKKTGGAVK